MTTELAQKPKRIKARHISVLIEREDGTSIMYSYGTTLDTKAEVSVEVTDSTSVMPHYRSIDKTPFMYTDLGSHLLLDIQFKRGVPVSKTAEELGV